MGLYRAQILLEESQHERLASLARDSGRSMSDLIREIVAEHLSRESEDEAVKRSLAAIDALACMREAVARRHGQLPVSFLEDMRSERDAELAP